LLLKLDQRYTWPDKHEQADTGQKDDREYGVELWPSISLSLGGAF